jgi:hypothetical protein
MNDQNTLQKIYSMAHQVCKPSRGVTNKAEPTISLTLFKTKHSKGETKLLVYRCRITRTGNKLALTINDKHTNEDDEERVYCLLLELLKFQKANKHRY